MSTNRKSDSGRYSAKYEMKLTVHERDNYQCQSCRETFDDPDKLHLHHIVPEGKAGPTTYRNLSTLCDRCHKAIHGERDHGPTIRFQSTGDMIQKDFVWYRHFWSEMLPAISQAALHPLRIEPIFAVSSKPYQAWHMRIGELRQADKRLAEMESVDYAPREAHHYM